MAIETQHVNKTEGDTHTYSHCCYLGTSSGLTLKSCYTCWFCAFFHWLPLRSWVCRGESAVCCRGGATQRCQGRQVSVGAAAARPGAVHGENDAVPIVMLFLQLVRGVQHRGREAYHLPTVCFVVLGSGALSPLAPFFCRLLESGLIIYTLRNRAKIQNSAVPTETFSHFSLLYCFIRAVFTPLHLL